MSSLTIDRLAGLASQTAMKGPCYAASTANLTLSGEQQVDGIGVVAGQRVLVKSQTDATENGIYIVSTGDWQRSADFSRNDDVREGTQVRVTDGVLNQGLWELSTSDPIVFDTSLLVFAATQPFGSAASQSQAEVGTNSTTGMTPLRVAQAVAYQVPKFATRTAAQAFTPVAAPTHIETEFYDTSQTAKSGARYVLNGSTSGHITITLADGVTHVGYDIEGGEVSATAFGMKVSATKETNLAAIKSAIAAAQAYGNGNGKVIIPNMTGTATIDTSGGLSAAAAITKRLTVQIDGQIKMSNAATGANPAYIFNITNTADGCWFTGTGSIEGMGSTFVDAASIINMPGFIYCEADDFHFDTIKCIKAPTTAIMLVACYRAVIRHCEMNGGHANFQFSFLGPDYTMANGAYVGSAHFGIVASGGGDHIFDGVRFTPGADGGHVINGIFTSGTYGNSDRNKTINCYADRPWEKLLYGYGDGQVIHGNTVIGDYGYVLTEAIRAWGSDNVISNNFVILGRGAVQVLDGASNQVIGNIFLRCRATGINVQHFTPGYVGGIDNNSVKNNIITWDGNAVERRFAIRILGNDQQDFTNCQVSGNIINGFGFASALSSGETGVEWAIEITSVSPRAAYNIDTQNNSFISCGNGIKHTRCVGGSVKGNSHYTGTGTAMKFDGGARIAVEGNTGENPGAWFLSIVSGNEPTGSTFRNNKSTGATNIGIRNFSTFGANSIDADGNQWTAKPLVGKATMAAAATTTITHGGIAPHAQIPLFPTETVSAAKIASAGAWGSVSTNDILVSSSGANFAGTESFGYRVIQ